MHSTKKVLSLLGVALFSSSAFAADNYVPPKESAGGWRQVHGARLGYLMAHDGRWGKKQLVPHWWIEEATKSSQQLNPNYGYTFWSTLTESNGRPFRKMRLRLWGLRRIAATWCLRSI